MYLHRFEGRVCVVTGGARGIGAAIATRLGLEGCRIAIADVDEAAGVARERDLRARGIEAIFVRADVASERDVENLMAIVYSRFGSIDVLINNAGIMPSGKDLEKQSLEEWRRVIDVNLTGVWLCSKHAVKYMKARGRGVILNIASTRALQSEPNTEPYSASKGGVVALTHAMAISLAKYGIRVLSISPGWVDTSAWQVPSREPKLTPLDHAQHPAGRVGRPEDVAALVAFLASDEAEWMTGVNIVIDGGMTVKMVYLDESVLEESLAVLLRDRELAHCMRRLIEVAREDPARTKTILREVIEKL